jgi:hypothetical protein
MKMTRWILTSVALIGLAAAVSSCAATTEALEAVNQRLDSVAPATSAASLAAVDTTAVDPFAILLGGWGPSSVREFNGRHDQDFAFRCPPDRESLQQTPRGTVYGTDRYETTSSVCAAAVHAGRLNAVTGGVVLVKMLPALEQYRGSERNGVTSRDRRGVQNTSFVFIEQSADLLPRPEHVMPSVAPRIPSEDAVPVSWTSALPRQWAEGLDYRVSCPAGGSVTTVVGSGHYSGTSRVCSAGVHMGLVTARDGGDFIIRVHRGMRSYVGGSRNGVDSNFRSATSNQRGYYVYPTRPSP